MSISRMCCNPLMLLERKKKKCQKEERLSGIKYGTFVLPPPLWTGSKLTGCCDIQIIHLPLTWRCTAECESGNSGSTGRLEGCRYPLPSTCTITIHGPKTQGQAQRTCALLAVHELVIHGYGIICSGAGVERLAEGLGNCAGIRIVWRVQVGRVGIVAAARFGAPRRDDGVATLADPCTFNPGREGTTLEATILDDGKGAVARGCR